MNIKFSPKNQYGIKMYWSKNTDKYSVLYDENDHKYYLRIWEDDAWHYPFWAQDGFDTIKDVEDFLNMHKWETATYRSIETDDDIINEQYADFQAAMRLLGFHRSEDPFFSNDIVYEYEMSAKSHTLQMRVLYEDGIMCPRVWVDYKKVSGLRDTRDVSRLLRGLEKYIVKYSEDGQIFSCVFLSDVKDRNSYTIEAGISTRDMLKNLVRVKSSNMWGMAINIKKHGDRFGDVIVQFKGRNGGPDDVYQYFDVPVNLYRKWISATSKGHFFWQYIRDNFKYRKLTGDKRGRLPNAIN